MEDALLVVKKLDTTSSLMYLEMSNVFLNAQLDLVLIVLTITCVENAQFFKRTVSLVISDLKMEFKSAKNVTIRDT